MSPFYLNLYILGVETFSRHVNIHFQKEYELEIYSIGGFSTMILVCY